MEFKSAILGFPKRILEWILGLVYFALTEVESFMMVVLGIILGILLGWLWGLAFFLLFWIAAHLIGGYASLLANAIRNSKR